MIWKGKGLSGRKVRLDLSGETQRRADKAEYYRLFLPPAVQHATKHPTLCNGARAQLKNKCEAALDTSFHRRSHYPLTRASCQFSHSHVSIGSAIVRAHLMPCLFVHGLFSHFAKGINR